MVVDKFGYFKEISYVLKSSVVSFGVDCLCVKVVELDSCVKFGEMMDILLEVEYMFELLK